MIKCKKVIAWVMSICVLSTMVGCGAENQKETQATTQTTTTEAISENAEEVATEEDAMPDVDGETIYIYTYDEQFENVMQYFYNRYPEYKERVQIVSANMGPTSDMYQKFVRDALSYTPPKKKDEDSEVEKEDIKYPSLVINSSLMASSFIQNNYSMGMSKLGITEEEMGQMYPFTLNKTRFQNEVKGLTWYTTPGAFMYRTDIAEAVLGTSDPVEVQKRISDWNRFSEVAEEIKEAGYKILSGPDEITFAMMQQKQTPWVVDETLRIDGSVSRCVGLSKQLVKDECTGDTSIIDEERKESFDSDVFGWFVYPEEIYSGMQTEEHTGEFRICEGPGPYQWGNDYITVSPKCKEKDLAALIVRTLCMDEEVMREMAQHNIFVNHQGIGSEMATGDSKCKQLGQQNAVAIFTNVLKDMKGEQMTPYDDLFESWVRELSYQYNEDQIKSIDELLEMFEDKVSDQYNYIFIDK